jgi:hypothetical protein
MFRVPEKYRVMTGNLATNKEMDGNNGYFIIPRPGKPPYAIVVIASDGMGWEHVSAHIDASWIGRTLTWDEMCLVKRLFWQDEDVVMQLHPKKSEYVNNHPNTLHLWRPTDREIPTPPSIMVGIKTTLPEKP